MSHIPNMLNKTTNFSLPGGVAPRCNSQEKPSSDLKSISLYIEPLIFNKALPGLSDNLTNTISHKGYSKIEIINLTFQEGYQHAAGLTMYCNTNFLFNVGRFLSPYNRNTLIVPINRYIVLNNQDIEIKANCRRPFKFTLSYQYHK